MRFIRQVIRQENIKNILLEKTREAREHVDVIKLFEPFKDKKIVWLSIGESLDVFLNKGHDIDIKLNEDEYLFLSSCQEIDYMQRIEINLIENLWKNDIDIDKVFVINSNSLGNTVNVKYIYWEYFETAIRLLPHNEIDISKKKHEKKFLCLNRMTKKHRVDFMNAMKERNLLNYFNASIWSDKLKLRYDTDDQNTNWWFSINEEFSYENSMWIVTESVFNNDIDLSFLSEKTFKPILLKMPFVIIGQPYSLKKLKSLGYKTFSHLWDESYDNILDPQKRMNKIVELVAYLSTLDLKKIIIDNADILEYNYKNLMNSKAEKNLLEVMDKI